MQVETKLEADLPAATDVTAPTAMRRTYPFDSKGEGREVALPFTGAPAHLDGTLPGDVGFDPLSIGQFYSIKWMREAELKHGRICMLASLGYISVDMGFKWPGAPDVSSLEAHDACVKNGSMFLMLGFIGIFESLSYSALAEMMSGETDRAPGDYYFDPLGLSRGTLKIDPFTLATMEIKHCRLAMLGFGGIVTQSALTGNSFPYTF